MPQAYRYVVADVFTDTPLTGNGLAVFTDARELREPVLQLLARELNLSETVFVYPPEGDGHVRIRIFTPTVELPFAGHPVLGTAFVLAGPLQLGEIRIETGAGMVPVRVERDDTARIVFGRLEQPVPTWREADGEAALLAALGVDAAAAPLTEYSSGLTYVYVALSSEQAVAALRPSFEGLAELGVAVVCYAGSGRRWKMRMFAPAEGIPEDPATGSAAGPLAVELARRGSVAWGDEIEISQGAELGRPSTLFARADGEGERVERVEVGGAAIVVARGEFRF
jgi:trans-2,3-dihydro-3-hydroxyanthranilate isomerase